MINSVEEYLAQLKEELAGSDPATIQDALTDAEEYLRTALGGDNGTENGEALAPVIEKYGTPGEVAVSYREIERYSPPAFDRPVSYREKAVTESAEEIQPEEPVAVKDSRPFYIRFFGIVADPRSWGALFYLFLAFGTGIVYFTWVVTGASLSVSLLILIIGLPFAALFIITVWGISLAEGRIVEALLGVRMPRRPHYYRKNMGWWPRLKSMLADKYTWLSLIYMLLQFPLGTFYFCFFITLFAVSLSLIATPIIQLGFNVPFTWDGGSHYFVGWFMPIVVIAGILLFFVTMHLAKLFGHCHGQLAKLMLVRT